MNIYLDIDGVLLINEKHASPYASEFIEYVLKHFPETTYWLTTHCWRGEDRTQEILEPVLDKDTLELIDNIQPTDWGENKTDAIDFSRPFLWFDDDLYDEERMVLQQHDSLDGFVLIDLHKDRFQLQKLVDNFPV